MKLLLQGETNSANSRCLNSVDRYFLGNYLQLLPAEKTNKDQFLPAKQTIKDEGNLAELSLIFKVWGIFWEELKLKYAMFVQQQLERVKEDDIPTFSFLGLKLFGKFRIPST